MEVAEKIESKWFNVIYRFITFIIHRIKNIVWLKIILLLTINII